MNFQLLQWLRKEGYFNSGKNKWQLLLFYEGKQEEILNKVTYYIVDIYGIVGTYSSGTKSMKKARKWPTGDYLNESIIRCYWVGVTTSSPKTYYTKYLELFWCHTNKKFFSVLPLKSKSHFKAGKKYMHQLFGMAAMHLCRDVGLSPKYYTIEM